MKAIIVGILGLLTFQSIAFADEYGVATYYFHPRYPHSFIAAHKYLPMGTRVRVHDLDNGRSVDVTIVDRGPFAGPSRAGRAPELIPQRRRIDVISPPPLAAMRERASASGSLTTAM
jgi:hypothetical protein